MNRIWLTGPGVNFRRRLEGALSRLGMPPQDRLESILSIDEMLSNIVEHGYHNGGGAVDVAVWKSSPGVLRVALLDRAPDTTWYQEPIQSLEETAHRLSSRGRGRAIAETLSRKIVHRRRPGGGNILVLEFDRSHHDASPRRASSMLTPNPQHLIAITKLSEYYETPVSYTEFQGVVRNTTVTKFREYLEQAGKRSPFLLVNLASVDYLSSTGVGALVEQARSQKKAQGWLRVVAPSSTVTMILNLSGVSELLSPVTSVEAGVKDLANKAA